MTRMDPLQTWLAALLTLLCLAVAIGSAKAEIEYRLVPHPLPKPCLTGDLGVTADGLVACEHGKWEHVQALCEYNMEAAMRAMEPFSAANAPIWNETEDVYRSGIRIEMHGRKFAAEMRRAIQTWERVKRECWRQP